jgi:molybdenum cofactor biosynthesis enzyme MoaA
MSNEKAFDILSQAYKLGVREVGFYLVSEPFMAKNLEACVAYAKQTGYEYIYLTTNGAMATKDRMERLLLNGLDSIKFSINKCRDSGNL